jgi:hypothetical protein
MRCRGVLGLCLAGVLGPAPAPAQDVSAAALFDFMYAKFAASYAPGRGKPAAGEFLVLANPGTPLAAENLTNLFYLWDLVDQVPRPTRLYQPSGQRVSEVFRRLLETAEMAGRQDQALRAKGQNAEMLLYDRYRPGQFTAEYSRYVDCEAAVAVAQDALASAQVEARAAGNPLAPDRLRALEDALAAARLDWEQKGSRARIAGALATLKKLYERNANVYFHGLTENLGKAELQGSYQADFYPDARRWLSNTGWQPWVFRASDLQGPPPQEAVPLGLAAAPAGPAAPAWTRTLMLQVELKHILVRRPWLDLAVFTNRAWRLGPGAGFTAVSTGSLEDPQPGPMPLVVTGLLLARNLTLRWSGDAGQAPGQVGPFRLAASGRAARVEKSTAGASLSAPDPQIVGFFCLVVPRSPDPDPKLFK